MNVLRVNENGIGFSRNGVNGPYTQAWTLDGRLVIGGTNVPSITVYDSNSNIIFQADASAMIWNADNSSMDSDGVITLVGTNSWAALENGTIFGGYGTTVGQNQTYISFNHTHNHEVGNILLNAKNIVFQADGIAVMPDQSTSSGTDGATIDQVYVTDISYDTYTFATDLDIQSDGQGGVSWSYTNVSLDVATGHSWRTLESISGILTNG